MNSHPGDEGIRADARWEALRERFVDRLLGGFVILAAVGLPVSVSRGLIFGWQSVYVAQSVIAAAVVLVFLFRRRLPFLAKAAFLLTILAILAAAGLLTFGLAGGGVAFLIFLQLVATSMFRPRHVLLWFVVALVAFVAVGVGFISGAIPLRIDFNHYMLQWSSWASMWALFGVLAAIAFHATGVTQHALLDLLDETERQRDRIAHLALHDPLTGLPQWRLAQDRFAVALAQARRSRSSIAVLFLDLDGFKSVNDSFGHDAGDHVLQTTAARLSERVRAEDTVARISGDEFVVILAGVVTPGIIAARAREIIASVSQPVVHAGQSLTVGISIGIAMFPDDAEDLDTLKQLADQAMYRVKRAGKNGFAFADPSRGEPPVSAKEA